MVLALGRSGLAGYPFGDRRPGPARSTSLPFARGNQPAFPARGLNRGAPLCASRAGGCFRTSGGDRLFRLFFLGMALRRPVQLVASSWLPRLFRLLGLLLLIFGIAWVVATRHEMALPGAVGAENEMHKAPPRVRVEISAKRSSAPRALWNGRRSGGSSIFPARWEKSGREAPAEALDDFRRARFLEPNVYEVPFQEGVVWLTRQPALAIAAWRETLRRVGMQRLEVYGTMLTLASQHSPAVRQGLEEIGMAHHDLALIYLQGRGRCRFHESASSPA